MEHPVSNEGEVLQAQNEPDVPVVSWLEKGPVDDMLQSVDSTSAKETKPIGVNAFWSKYIPQINKTFLIITGLFVFGIDLVILVVNPGLLGYWIPMVASFFALLVFCEFEKWIAKKKLAHSLSQFDGLMLLVIIARNVALLLNVIPVIQLLGIVLVVWGVIPFLLLYAFLIYVRYQSPRVEV